VELEFWESGGGGFKERSELAGFIAELRRISEVLELASAAGAEVRAGGSGAVLRLDGCGIE
jgi:hypothetical protein